jgi:hypothetical protein
VGLWRYIGRAALELGAHAPPAASIAVEKLQASLAPVEGQQDADGSERGSEGYGGMGTTRAQCWGWSPYADFTKGYGADL